MAQDYILFIHGVDTQGKDHITPTYADTLIKLIQHSKLTHLSFTPLYWGDLVKPDEDRVLELYRASSIWSQMWFRAFRETTFLRAVGDVGLYLSRCVGAEIIKQVTQQALQGIAGYTPEDRLHLVTHSLGTIILFDLLFGSRWANASTLGHDDVMALRSAIYGLGPDTTTGIRLGSIHTMGSPLGVFSLLNATTPDCGNQDEYGTHQSVNDIRPQLQQMLSMLETQRKRSLIWRNFVHPGDPIGTPLETIIPHLVQNDDTVLDAKDIVTFGEAFSDYLFAPFSQTSIALLYGGAAHQSYWTSQKVADVIAQTIQGERG
ncbi:MAG: hypothetical protein JOZ18_12875 [Chloroflexi bacterium]|nr:hypothetical protein [Chloroflexota bacterium]